MLTGIGCRPVESGISDEVTIRLWKLKISSTGTESRRVTVHINILHIEPVIVGRGTPCKIIWIFGLSSTCTAVSVYDVVPYKSKVTPEVVLVTNIKGIILLTQPDKGAEEQGNQ